MAPGLAFVAAQRASIPIPTTSFAGQTIIVTGSNVGLGLEAARHFARLDAARVILGVRTPSKGETAKADIEATTKRPNVVEVWEIDMSKYDSIQSFAKRCESLDRLDVLVANAGILKSAFEEAEGTEITVTVNVIGTFLLAFNLFPMMRRSQEKTGQTPRVTIVSSFLYEEAKFVERREASIFEAFKKNKKADLAERYNTSKLLEVLLARSIVAAMKKGPHSAVPIIINTVNPGLCHSEIGRDLQGVAGRFFSVLKAMLARTTEVGSRTLVHGASAGEESNGQYLSECEVKQPRSFVLKPEGVELQERVHAELMDILENIQPGITENI